MMTLVVVKKRATHKKSLVLNVANQKYTIMRFVRLNVAEVIAQKISNKMNINNIVLPKWPSCVVVGENVTEEQGLEICLRTSSLYISCNDNEWTKSVTNLLGIKVDGYFLDLDSVEEVESKYGILRLEYLDTDRIASSYIDGPNGWCDWNGNIGLTNKNIGKWPSTEEVLEEWKLIAKTFPFLTLSCQLYDKEHCEEDGKPLIQYDVKNGEVNWFIPSAPLIENIPELPFVSIFSEERNERGCTLEQLKKAMEICLR
jgi:hypothetical protein